MNQNFYGSVDQVAGRDIINVADTMLWHCEIPDLRQELTRCRRKLWQARINLFLNVPVAWMVIGLLVGVVLLFSGAIFRQGNEMLLWAWAIGGVFAPSIWLTQIRKREGQAVAFYRGRIDCIALILRDRA